MNDHIIKTGYIKEGQTTKGARYFTVRYCTNCKHYDVFDLTYELDDDLKVITSKSYKRGLAKDCPEKAKAEVVK